MRILARIILIIAMSALPGMGARAAIDSKLLSLPDSTDMADFVDVDGDGRLDLLVLNTVERTLSNYHQTQSGFSNAPDQVVRLLPGTGWVTLRDADPNPGLELVASTQNGIVYLRQNGGLFETNWHTLIAASDIFTNSEAPVLLLRNGSNVKTNNTIPLIGVGEATVYRRNDKYEWTPGGAVGLNSRQATWDVDTKGGHSMWTAGGSPGYSLNVKQSFRVKPDITEKRKPENESIRKILDDMKKTPAASPPQTTYADLNGDGREDVVLWQASGVLDFKTDLYIFLRGGDLKLPERPSEVLHCRGFPIPLGNSERWSPFKDINGDGVCELALLEFDTAFSTASGLIKTALSHGLDFDLAIRTVHNGVFMRRPDATVPVKMVLPAEILNAWSIFIQGDFNGDNRMDLLVRRSERQWNVFLSTNDGRWFGKEPAMTFETTAEGQIEILDLNGDGISDIVWYELNRPNLHVFLSPFPGVKAAK